MLYNPQGKMECRKRLAWTIASEQAVVTKEDAVTIYNRLMNEFSDIDKRAKYKQAESNKSQ
jgi:hypothetical protein